MDAPHPEGALPPDTYTNETNGRSKYPLFVILLDSLNTAMSDQSFAQEELLKLAEELPRGSRVAVFRLGNRLSMLHGSTEDAAELVETIKSKKAAPQLGNFFDDPNLDLALNAPDPTAGMGMKGGPGVTDVQHTFALQDPNEEGIRSDLTIDATIRALKALGLYLSQFRGRKNLVWLAGTFPIDIIPTTGTLGLESSGLAGSPDPFRGNRSYTISILDLALLLQSGNIAMYPVDVRGLIDTGLYNSAAVGAQGNGATVAATQLTLAAFAGSNGQMHEIMQTIAHDTGGRAYYNTNDLTGSMMEAFNDGSNYYSISYLPANQKWDGQFRKIRIGVDRDASKLYYRQGYYAKDTDKLRHSFPSPDSTMKTAMLRGSPAVAEIIFSRKGRTGGGRSEYRGNQAGTEVARRQDVSAADWPGRPLYDRVRDQLFTNPVLYFGCYLPRPSGLFGDRLRCGRGKMLNSDIGGFRHPAESSGLCGRSARCTPHSERESICHRGKVFLRARSTRSLQLNKTRLV